MTTQMTAYIAYLNQQVLEAQKIGMQPEATADIVEELYNLTSPSYPTACDDIIL